ncbi:hypothetical protein BDR07DRAFT_613581 [Suillus spraguei]|nr:hypothetical protein BDR07DRAFT_613581 [Suillus spraguei]
MLIECRAVSSFFRVHRVVRRSVYLSLRGGAAVLAGVVLSHFLHPRHLPVFAFASLNIFGYLYLIVLSHSKLAFLRSSSMPAFLRKCPCMKLRVLDESMIVQLITFYMTNVLSIVV